MNNRIKIRNEYASDTGKAFDSNLKQYNVWLEMQLINERNNQVKKSLDVETVKLREVCTKCNRGVVYRNCKVRTCTFCYESREVNE